MARRKRSREQYYFHGALGADDLVPEKKTDWFWPVAIVLTLGAVALVIVNTRQGEINGQDAQKSGA